MAEPADPDTGLPIADPFPRDVEPEGGPIGPGDDPGPTDPESAGTVGPAPVARGGDANPPRPRPVVARAVPGDRPHLPDGADRSGLGYPVRQDSSGGSATATGDDDSSAPNPPLSSTDNESGASAEAEEGIRRGEPAPSVTAAPQATARGDTPRGAASVADDASLGASQPVGLDEGLGGPTLPTTPALSAAADGTPASVSTGAVVPRGAIPGRGGAACAPGYPVKAETTTMRYRTPGDADYRQCVPDFCFRNSAAAAAAGFGAA